MEEFTVFPQTPFLNLEKSVFIYLHVDDMQVNIPERPRALTDDLLGVIPAGCYCDTPVMFTEITT